MATFFPHPETPALALHRAPAWASWAPPPRSFETRVFSAFTQAFQVLLSAILAPHLTLAPLCTLCFLIGSSHNSLHLHTNFLHDCAPHPSEIFAFSKKSCLCSSCRAGSILRQTILVGARLGVYDALKNALADKDGRLDFATSLACGAAAGAIAASVGNPADLVMARPTFSLPETL